MKKYLIDPKLSWYKANLHCHTTHSDGYYSPEEIKRIYMERGYSIVAFSDHEVIFDNSFLSDENFVALTAVEYSIKQHIHDNTVPARIRDRDYLTIHLNMISRNPHSLFHPASFSEGFEDHQIKKFRKVYNMEIPCDGYHREYTQESIQETIDRANKAGFLVQFNHPNWSLNIRDDYINLKGLWALEIYNYLSDIETSAEYCPNIYDDMLRHGHRLFCTMGDDNHNFGGSLEGSFGGFNYVGVPSLTYDNVFNALETGNFYASMGPIIKWMYFDTKEKKIYLECSEAVDIIFTAYNRIFAHYHGDNLTKADFMLFGGEEYFRITIRDKYGKCANTHAYYISELTDEAIK